MALHFLDKLVAVRLKPRPKSVRTSFDMTSCVMAFTDNNYHDRGLPALLRISPWKLCLGF